MGQAATQGGSLQAWQTTTAKSPSRPPWVLTLMALLAREARPVLILLQANMQERHPMHLSGWATFSLLLFLFALSASPSASPVPIPGALGSTRS